MQAIGSVPEPLGTPRSQAGAADLIALTKRVEQQVQGLRTFAQDQPGEGRAALASALARLGSLYAERGRLKESVSAVQDAIDIFRDLVQTDPRRALDLVAALVDLATIHYGFENLREAASAATEAANELRPVLHTAEPNVLPRLASTLSKLDALTGQRLPELSVDAASIYRRLHGEFGQQQYANALLETLRRATKQLSRFGRIDQSHQFALEAESLEEQISGRTGSNSTGMRTVGRLPLGDNGAPPAPPPAPPAPSTSRDDDMNDRLKRLEQLNDKVFDRLGAIEKDVATVKTRSEALATEKDVATLIAKSDTFATDKTVRDVADVIRKEMKHDFWILLSAIAAASLSILTTLWLKKP